MHGCTPSIVKQLNATSYSLIHAIQFTTGIHQIFRSVNKTKLDKYTLYEEHSNHGERTVYTLSSSIRAVVFKLWVAKLSVMDHEYLD